MILAFDIIPREYDFWQNLYCLVMYILIIFSFYDSNVCTRREWYNNHDKKCTWLFLLYFIVTLTLFCDHDYYGYYKIVKTTLFGINSHLEVPYAEIIKYFNRNYLMFRLSVWGSALVLFCIGAKEVDRNIYHPLFFLTICFYCTFAYGRVSLAMAMCFCGYTLFYNNIRNKKWKALIGAALFVCSFFFHKSIMFAMFTAILMTYVPINKWTARIGFIFVPILIIAVKIAFHHIVQNGVMIDEKTAQIAMAYTAAEKAKATSILNYIGIALNYSVYYISAYLGIKTLYLENKKLIATKMSVNLYKISLGLIFFGTCFFFFDMNNKIFAYRIMYMAMIPLAYCMTSFYGRGVLTKEQFKMIITFGIINSLYYVGYLTYAQLK